MIAILKTGLVMGAAILGARGIESYAGLKSPILSALLAGLGGAVAAVAMAWVVGMAAKTVGV